MYFQIKEIILWPKDTSKKPRRLEFTLGAVNVISGASRTGKSAIIPIIDYCLGSDKCTIPVNTIRDTTSWFGVIVDTVAGQKLFARREPGNQKSTGDMFVLEGRQIDVPDVIEAKNSTADIVKRTLDELAGLTALDFNVEGGNTGFRGRPSFRDLGAFIFQPQNIVANPDVFFYKADTYEHREKLRTIFPYVLNAITPQLLAKEHELANLRKELRRKQNELSNVRAVSARWMAEIRARATEAREFGLVREPIPEDATRDRLIELLTQVVEGSNVEIRVTSDTISDAVGELMNLQSEEAAASLELSALRRRYSEMSSFMQSAVQYRGALQIQRDRLKISDWLRGLHDPQHDCPVCGNNINGATDDLNSLFRSLEEIEKTAGEFDQMPASFDREYERVKAEMRTVSEKLRGIRIRITALEQRSEEAKRRQYDSLKVSRFIGNLEQSLITYAQLGADSELDAEVTELRQQVARLESEIAQGEIKAKTKRALQMVSLNAEKLMPSLDSERPNDPITLSIDDLTIKVEGIDREDYLWEIGSGSNWLSYHIAVTLGLHQFFMNLKVSPVPGFIVYDQPSQVYFPKRLAAREGEEDLDPQFVKDEDIDAVQKVFSTLSAVVGRSKGSLQIIVLDHAAENVWGGLEYAHLVEEWREGRKLVPLNWIDEK
jgi:chromosome segregation ATPase